MCPEATATAQHWGGSCGEEGREEVLGSVCMCTGKCHGLRPAVL